MKGFKIFSKKEGKFKNNNWHQRRSYKKKKIKFIDKNKRKLNKSEYIKYFNKKQFFK